MCDHPVECESSLCVYEFAINIISNIGIQLLSISNALIVLV